MQMKRFMFVSGLVLSFGLSTCGAEYYVDATASKGGDGSARAPFATIQAAADVAQAGDTVFIKPGTYSETVKPKNSGTKEKPIVFRNCPGEAKPTICAGDRVTGPWKAEGGGIYSAACNWGMGVGRNQVVVDGDLMIEAREPNIAGRDQLVETFVLGRMLGCKVGKDDVVVTGAPKSDPDFWKGGVVWICGGWAAANAVVTGSRMEGADCRLAVTNKTIDWWGQGSICFLTGTRGALDCEKEFYLDESAGRLYLMAPGAADPSGMTVLVKKRRLVLDLTGRNHVVMDRINTMMGCLMLKGATGCAILNGRHFYSSHFYLFAYGPGGNPLGTTPDDPLASAMYISGEGNTLEGCEVAYAATGVRLDGRDQVIRNCIIRDAYGGNYFSCVFIAGMEPVGKDFGGHRIEWNTIGRGSRGLVHWTTMTFPGVPSLYRKCQVRHNHFFDFNEFCNDGGATYAWHVNGGGTEIAYNWVHGDRGTYHFNPGFYADNDTSNWRYHHNVAWDVKIGIGWNQTTGFLEAYNNTVWSRGGDKGESIKVTVPVPGCKIYNNLANQTIGGAGPASSLTNNLTVGGGFAGNPDKPASGLDFMPAKGSPAIDAGVEVPGVTDGAIGKPDIGAYEHGGPAWMAGAGTEPVAPAAPIEFSGTAVGAQGVRLGWTDVAFNEQAYVLERSTDGKTWSALATLPADAFTYLDAGFHMKAGTAYQYRLAVTNGYGRSAWVVVKTATPEAATKPAITSALAAKTMQAAFFTYTITAANDPAEVTAEGLPKGLSLNAATGVMAGYPEEAGEAKVKITATNAKGSDTKALALTIAKREPVMATGATVTEYADAAGVRWTVLTFTNNGSFTVSGGPAEYLIVAGGGGGGASGGGGAGGVITGAVVTLQGEHKVVVGSGVAAVNNGEPSSIVGPSITWTATGGGAGGTWKVDGKDGGCGGGAGKNTAKGGRARPPIPVATRLDATLRHGHKGGDSNGDTYRGAGGGGAGGPGEDGSSDGPGPAGGPGISSTILDGKTAVWYAGGGGGGGSVLGNPGGAGGSGIGGNGSGKDGPATDGKPGTGSGGGAVGDDGKTGGKGGSGIVIVRFVRTGK